MPFVHNVIGYLSSDSGLGQSARHLARKLMQSGEEVFVTNASTGDERSDRILLDEFKPFRDNEISGRVVHWLHLNPPEFGDSWGQSFPMQLQTPEALLIAVPYLELERIHKFWVRRLEACDAIAAPTKFIAESLKNSGLTQPILQIPLLIESPVDEVPEGNRQSFGLPSSGFLFLCFFDLSSGPSRKNPEAAIRAFIAAFPDPKPGPDAPHLVIKMNNPDILKGASDSIQELVKQSRVFENIHWRTDNIPETELMAFQACFDALISLHRSEGLGLVPVEMMSLGKPAVITGYSGNMDYSTPENSMLVPFDRVPVRVVHPVYAMALKEMPDLTWAEPKIPEAAEAMRKLATDSKLYANLSSQARQDIQSLSEQSWSTTLNEIMQISPSSSKRDWTERYSWCTCPWAENIRPNQHWRIRWGQKWSDFKVRNNLNFRILRG